MHALPVTAAVVQPAAMYRIEFKQMRRASCIARNLIDLHNLIGRIFPASAKAQSPHAPETIDTNTNTHDFSPL